MTSCSVEGCDKAHHALGLCRQHWVRQRKYGRLHKIRGIKKPICSVEGCGKPSKSIGLCNNHYQRQYKFGRLHKVLIGDKRKHPLYMMWWERKKYGAISPEWNDFWDFVKDVGERPGKDFVIIRLRDEPYGPTNFKWQKVLKRFPGETKKSFHAREWASRRKRFPFYECDRALRRKYGITLAQYEEILASQNGVCAICKRKETSFDVKTRGVRRLSVDHCHKTKKVRALLCFSCNSVIGRIEESQEWVKAISEYLIKHQQEF